MAVVDMIVFMIGSVVVVGIHVEVGSVVVVDMKVFMLKLIRYLLLILCYSC